ncbi:T9SS type A sorting domain-containing protein [Lacinutrix sp. C3R15]|uniref:T9SS type A sorting domain-containing protein n=1 Tax=Flavobacteriaceae TaxID=49546 RepID=UPI001C08A233|nr:MULTISPECIES: T9SS type A sorting domain-containing protein [Flavobacteriaceae]MBU2938721.1 T9SS type A sorting domain-containing protein [Lacinutrix sp. C3R15]MDO6622034.1 T9SS type A sorting domain-containing protein [Oceanihabitans sp. 1_MG-2023]
MKKKLLTCLSLLSLSAIGFAQTTFESKVTINANTGANPYTIDSGLLDNDAYPDIVIGTDGGNTVEWYKNNGDGTFANAVTLTATGTEALLYVEGVHIADLDGINGNDILATSYGNSNLVWFANNGDGTFADAETIGQSLISGAGSVTTGYIDAGNTLDVVVLAYGSSDVFWFSNDGSGNFTGPFSITSVAGTGPGAIDLADYDGDGDLDAVIANTDAGTIEIYDNNLLPSGAGTVSFTKYMNTVSSGNGYLFDIEFVDVNDDGTLDILKSDNSPSTGNSNIAYYTKDTSGTATTFTETTISTSITRTSLATVADFDNDTKNDLLVTNGRVTNDDIIWFESNNTGGFAPEVSLDNTQSTIYGMTINDFDNDGDLDIATVSYFQDDLNWFENKLITLDVEDNTLQEITMYPNPVKNSLYFKGNITDDLNVSVYNVLGKQVLNAIVNQNQALDVSNLNNGVYIIKFNNYNSTYKFVKQ